MYEYCGLYTRAYALAHLHICDNNQELNGRLNPGAIVGATGQREVKTMDVLSKAREKVSRVRPHMLKRHERVHARYQRAYIAQRKRVSVKNKVHREKTNVKMYQQTNVWKRNEKKTKKK